MWVARRCAGLALIVAAIIASPGLVTAYLFYTQFAEVFRLTVQAQGLGGLSTSGGGAAMTFFVSALLQVLIPLIAGLLLLFGLPRPSRGIVKRVANGEV